MNMMTICKSIGDILYEKGVIGHVTVDLVSFPDPTSPSAHPLFWAIDLNCNFSDYVASCLFFDFLMVSFVIIFSHIYLFLLGGKN
jgi:IQ domain-containing protein H